MPDDQNTGPTNTAAQNQNTIDWVEEQLLEMLDEKFVDFDDQHKNIRANLSLVSGMLMSGDTNTFPGEVIQAIAKTLAGKMKGRASKFGDRSRSSRASVAETLESLSQRVKSGGTPE